MTHQLINTGAGWRCLRCKVAWDQGEAAPETCEEDLPVSYEDLFARDVPLDWGLLKRFWTEQAARLAPKPDTTYAGRPVVEPTKSIIPVPRSPTPPKPDAMTRMVGGTHYSKLVIQPTEFCMRNGLDFCIGSILKYLTRWRSKNGLEDIRKARHFVEIREAFPHDIHPPRQIAITMLEYVTRNNIRPDDAEALYRLEAYYNAVGHHARIGADRLLLEIDRLMDRAALT